MGSSLSEIVRPRAEIIASEGLLSGAGWSFEPEHSTAPGPDETFVRLDMFSK